MTSPPDGPVEWVAITFPGTTLGAGVAAPHAELVDAKTVRLLDAAVVHKAADGTITEGELADETTVFDAVDGDVLELLSHDDLEARDRARRDHAVRRGLGRGRRGPGLLGTTARTAVVAGTASAVAGRVGAAQEAAAQRDGQAGAAHEERRRLRMQNEVETQVAEALRAEAAAPAAPAASVDDIYAQLTKLGELRERGLLTEAEFAQQKARLLG